MSSKSILIAAAALFLAFSPVAVTDAQQKQGMRTIKVDVDLVLITATVTDFDGRYITGLGKEHFQIWEDKVEQTIAHFSSEDVPISVGVVFDISGSMKDKISTARDAAATFLKAGNPDDEYFLVEFNDRAQVAENFTADAAKLQTHLIFTPAKGQTALLDAVYLALNKLKEASNPRKALLLITDGEDNHSRYSFSNVKEFVRESDAQIFAIGIVDEWSTGWRMGQVGRILVEDLVKISGGQAFFPGSVDELEDICLKIGVELKNQYVLGYVSANESKDGKWRKIHVKVNPPKGVPRLTVRAKTGYYAPSSEDFPIN